MMADRRRGPAAPPPDAAPRRSRPSGAAKTARHGVLLLGLALTWGPPAAAHAQIVGSAHDFSGEAWSAGRICVVCHTPHDAMAAVEPLWDHDVTVAVFDVYTSPTLDVAPGQPAGVSKLCLSCHDGTVGVDQFGGRTGTEFLTGAARLGTDLGNDHPVSMSWQHQTRTPNCSNCHQLHLPGVVNSDVPFYSGRVECASCHDVHAGTGLPSLLRKSNVASGLCRHCHLK